MRMPTAKQYVHAFVLAVRADAPIYAAVALYLVVGAIYVQANGGIVLGALPTYIRLFLINYGAIAPYIVLVVGVWHVLHRLRARRALAFRHMFAAPRIGRFLAGTLLMLTALLLFQAMFASVKSVLSTGPGFAFDTVLADLDKALHFGVDPWRYLRFLENDVALRLIEINYNAVWFIVCFGTLYWFVTSPRADRLRNRYVLSALLLWMIIGNLLAGIFMSAGPVYFGHVTGDTARFSEQLVFIARSAGQFSSAADYQAYLWHLHSTGSEGFGSGISAFPSMHLALITLNALFALELSRRLGLIAFAYVALVQLSSVYLGWHYAVDGYFSILAAGLVYYATRWAEPWLRSLRLRKVGAAEPNLA
jgi:uncharacterized membrane protein